MTKPFTIRCSIWLDNQNWRPAASIVLGVAAFVLITGGHIISSGNIDWLMVGDDGGTHYLGWEFFRQSPLFQWPLGANPQYGMEISSSIVYTDSIPLMALILKPFSPLLPSVFQYHGIWLLGCFILQAYFASRIVSSVTDNFLLNLIGIAFALTTPIFLFRIWNSHYAGAGHWILLASIYLYVSKDFRSKAWLILFAVAPLVNAYLFVMAAGFYAADTAQRLWKKEQKVNRILAHAALGVFLAIFVMWLSGFFMASKYTAGQGFGFYRMNILAAFNPMGDWSRFIPPMATAEGDFEGFNYLGLGVISLVFLTPFLLLNSQLATGWKKSLLPIMIMATLAAVFALSNNVAVGNYTLFTFEIPPQIWPIVSTFRASGRMFWPAYYLILFASIAIVILRCKQTTAIPILLTALAIQLVDISAGISEVRSKLVDSPSWTSPMKSQVWEVIGRKYDRITVVLPFKHYPDYLPLAEFATTHNMGTNGVYLARVNQKNLLDSQAMIASEITAGEFNSNSVYIFSDENLWLASRTNIDESDMRGVLDGFKIVAPGLRNCTDCGQQDLTDFELD